MDTSRNMAHSILVITAMHVCRCVTVIRLIEDAPQLQPSFPCNKLWVMMIGKLPNWRRTSSLEHFMRNFWSLSSQCLCIKVEFRNNYNATNSWECLSHIFECQITILTGKKLPFSMYFLGLAERSNWRKYYWYFILCTCSSLVVNSNQKNRCFRRIFQV